MKEFWSHLTKRYVNHSSLNSEVAAVACPPFRNRNQLLLTASFHADYSEVRQIAWLTSNMGEVDYYLRGINGLSLENALEASKLVRYRD